MKKRQIKQGVYFGLAVSVLALVLVLIKPELASAYDVVDDIVKVTAEDGTDFNAIYEKYKDHSIIELPRGTYTLSDTLVIDDPVIIRVAAGLSADDVIIDGGAMKETGIITDDVWQAHLNLIYNALTGEQDDYDLLAQLIPLALIKYPKNETGHGAKLWQWVRKDLLQLDDDYVHQTGNHTHKNFLELGTIPVEINASLRYKINATYVANNLERLKASFEAKFSAAERTDKGFKHQLHMDNAYAMIEGVTLQHFMGFQSLTRDKKHIANLPATVDYHATLAPQLASAISVNGSLNRVKVINNFMGDILPVDQNTLQYTSYLQNRNQYEDQYPPHDATYEDYETHGRGYGAKYDITFEEELPSPILLVNGGAISNSLIAYNGYTFIDDEGTVKGAFDWIDWANSEIEREVKYRVGDYAAVVTLGYSRWTNNTIANNNSRFNFLAFDGDLVFQNNILLSLVGVSGEDSNYNANSLWLKPQDINVSFKRANGQPPGNISDYYLTLSGSGIKNYQANGQNLNTLFTNVASGTTGYRNADGSYNEKFDFTPRSDSSVIVDQAVDCYYPQIGFDVAGHSRILGTKPDFGAYEATGATPSWAIDGIDDDNKDFYITLDGDGKKDGSSWENAYACRNDIQYGIILAHRAGAENIYLGEGSFNVYGKPYLYTGYANGYTTTIWDGVVLAPTLSSLAEDTTKGMSLYGLNEQTDSGEPKTRLIGQNQSGLYYEKNLTLQGYISGSTFGAPPSLADDPDYSSYYNNNLANLKYAWSNYPSHAARVTYGARIVSQVEPVKGIVDSVLIEKGYVATAKTTQQSTRWTISEEIANHNLAKGGGGIYLWNGTLRNSLVQGNYEARAFLNQFLGCGGGVFLNDSSTMENSTVKGNISETNGGGVLAVGANTTVKNSLITGNIAFENGGGLATGVQPATGKSTANPTKVINTVISGNYALGVSWATDDSNYRNWSIAADASVGKGGGLILYEQAEVKGSTIVDNYAPKGDNVNMAGGILKNTAMYSTNKSTLMSDLEDLMYGAVPNYESSWPYYNLSSNGQALAAIFSPFLPSLPREEANVWANGPDKAKIFKFFIIPRISERNDISEFVDLAIDGANADLIQSNIDHSAFKTVATNTENVLTKVADASTIGSDNLVYTDIKSLLGLAEDIEAPEASIHGVSTYALPMYAENLASDAGVALLASSQLANAGAADAEMLRDYFGYGRTMADIGAFASTGSVPPVNYELTYHAGTTDAVSNLPIGQVIKKGADSTVSEQLPQRTGYRFLYWRDDEEKIYHAGNTISNMQANLRLTARWQAEYSVTYLPGADNVTNLPTPNPVTGLISGKEPYKISKTVPERSGYRFIGWSDGVKIYQAQSDIEIEDNITLTAQWEKIEAPVTSFNVIYQTGTDETVSQMPTNAIVEQGASYTLASQIPIRQGYLFTGWQSADDTLYQPNASLQNIQADVTLVAQWQAISGFQVIYQAGTDAAVKDLPISAEIEAGADYTLSGLRPKRESYKFTGWLADDEVGTLYQPSARLTNVQGNLVLTAQWEKVKAEVDKEAEKETPNQSETPPSSSNADEKQSLKAKEKMETLHLLPMTGEADHVPVFLIIVIGGISLSLWHWKKQHNFHD